MKINSILPLALSLSFLGLGSAFALPSLAQTQAELDEAWQKEVQPALDMCNNSLGGEITDLRTGVTIKCPGPATNPPAEQTQEGQTEEQKICKDREGFVPYTLSNGESGTALCTGSPRLQLERQQEGEDK